MRSSKIRDAIATVQHLAVIVSVVFAAEIYISDRFPDLLARAAAIAESSYVKTAIVIAHTADQDALGADLGLPMIEVPSDRSVTHTLDAGLFCPPGYRPTTTWHTIEGARPDLDVIYGLNTSLLPSGQVQVRMRARPTPGHIFLGVHVLCQRT